MSPVDVGAFTFERLQQCCTRRLVMQFNGWTSFLNDTTRMPAALIEHMPLNVLENRQFVVDSLPAKALTFTVLREPRAQFISYYQQLTLG